MNTTETETTNGHWPAMFVCVYFLVFSVFFVKQRVCVYIILYNPDDARKM
jgi:hypothetical protein